MFRKRVRQLPCGGNYVIRRAEVEDLISLRHTELRAGLPVATAHFEKDGLPSSVHIGLYLLDRRADEGRVIGCATFVEDEWEGEPAWRLRGMAIADAYQRQGLGVQLLTFADSLISELSAARLAWCDARVSAIGFYEKQGWSVASDEFEIPTAGLHRKMLKEL